MASDDLAFLFYMGIVAAMAYVLSQDGLRAARLSAGCVGSPRGGIAHDFNNFLTIIAGNISLAKMRIPPADPV